MPDSPAPKPSIGGTLCITLGCFAAVFIANGNTPDEQCHVFSVIILISLSLSVWLDYQGSLRNLVRADLLAMASLYFFTLFEFLIPGNNLLDQRISMAEIQPALLACALGFSTLAIARHFHPRPSRELNRLFTYDASPRFVLCLFWLCFFGGFAHMLATVDFNIVRMVEAFMGPRFSQPWQRGQYGDWKALLHEFGMLIYIVPPIAGHLLSERKKYGSLHLVAIFAAFSFTLFYGFSSGTRNLLATYLATFLIAYALSASETKRKEIIAVTLVTVLVLIQSTTLMLDFRNIGLRNYITGHAELSQSTDEVFFVDNNLFAMAKIMQVFPQPYEYLGLEIPYLAIIRPIPRAIWPGKPEGMSVSIERALQAEDMGLTIAVTYLGEAFMSFGMTGVILSSLLLGSLLGWWNQYGRRDSSAFGCFVYASGFFAVTMTMRSLLILTTTILPTLLILYIGAQAIRSGIAERRRLREHES